jgi:hypothetical protein
VKARLAAALLFAIPLAGACSFLLDWGQEGLPCDDANACADGFGCDPKDHTCKAALFNSSPCGNLCAGGQECRVGGGPGKKPTCVPRGCVAAGCGPDESCVVAAGSDGGPKVACNPNVPGRVGSPCVDDPGCAGLGGSGKCIVGPALGLSYAHGFCTKTCANDGECAPNPGDVGYSCQKLSLPSGSSQSLCFPPSFVSCPSPACTASPDAGASCTFYRVPGQLPIPGCTRNIGTVLSGGACGGGSPEACRSGLCVPFGAPAGYCGGACDADRDCPAGWRCGPGRPFEWKSLANMCLPRYALCQACTGNSSCGPDAPECIQGRCTRTCDTAADCAFFGVDGGAPICDVVGGGTTRYCCF